MLCSSSRHAVPIAQQHATGALCAVATENTAWSVLLWKILVAWQSTCSSVPHARSQTRTTYVLHVSFMLDSSPVLTIQTAQRCELGATAPRQTLRSKTCMWGPVAAHCPGTALVLLPKCTSFMSSCAFAFMKSVYTCEHFAAATVLPPSPSLSLSTVNLLQFA